MTPIHIVQRVQKTALKLLCGALLGAAAQVACAGTVLADAAPSPNLGRDVKFTVYLPDGYPQGTAALPVIYLLHGAGGDENEWRTLGGAVETLDGLIKRGLLRPSVVVMPTTGPASWWADGAAEKAGSAFMKDLLPYVEARYRVQKERSGRAIGGLSMGGYGALNLSLRHPDQFCGAAVISPAIYDPLPPETSAARRTPQFVRNGQFDADTWKALNYASQIDTYAQSKYKVPMWIVSGDHDFLGIAPMSANLFWRLLKIQPRQVELRVIDGDHEWLTFRDALPEALQYVDRQCIKG
jgi:S-formylglutathione hydrolase FrmB